MSGEQIPLFMPDLEGDVRMDDMQDAACTMVSNIDGHKIALNEHKKKLDVRANIITREAVFQAPANSSLRRSQSAINVKITYKSHKTKIWTIL